MADQRLLAIQQSYAAVNSNSRIITTSSPTTTATSADSPSPGPVAGFFHLQHSGSSCAAVLAMSKWVHAKCTATKSAPLAASKSAPAVIKASVVASKASLTNVAPTPGLAVTGGGGESSLAVAATCCFSCIHANNNVIGVERVLWCAVIHFTPFVDHLVQDFLFYFTKRKRKIIHFIVQE
jgi:hypothetical protein